MTKVKAFNLRLGSRPSKSSLSKAATRISIDIKIIERHRSIGSKPLAHFIKHVLAAEKIRGADLCIVCADRQLLRQLNRRFSAKDVDTDVLSFDLKREKRVRGYLAGDVVVSVDQAMSVASTLGLSYKEEIYRYVLHGILHLAGYDDLTRGKKKRMWKRQEYLLNKYF